MIFIIFNLKYWVVTLYATWLRTSFGLSHSSKTKFLVWRTFWLFFILSVVQLVRRLSIFKYSLCFHKMKLSRITMTGGKLRRKFAQNMAASLWNSRDYPKYCQEMRGISNLLPTAFMEKWEKVGKGGRLWRKCMSPRKFPFSLVRVWGAARRKRDLSVFSGMRIFSILRWAAILK